MNASREPSFLKRITSLEIDSRSAEAYTYDPSPLSSFALEVLQKFISSEDSSTSDERSRVIRNLCTELVLAIRDLRSLVIVQNSTVMDWNNDLFHSLVSRVWSHQTKEPSTMTLRHVSYKGHCQDIQHLLSMNSDLSHRVLSLLESLTFVYMPARERSYTNSLASFFEVLEGSPSPGPVASPSRPLQATSSTPFSQLRSLSLDLKEYIDLTGYVFQALSCNRRAFPYLTHLSLTGDEEFSPTRPLYPVELLPFSNLLARHQSTITHLRIPIRALRPIPYGGPADQHHSLEHPAPRMIALEHLEIWGGSDVPLFVVENARTSLRRKGGGCVVRSESNMPSQTRDFVGFLDLTPILQSHPTFYRGGVLRSLALELFTLTPMHFDLLSGYLPQLHQLRLSIYMARFPFWRYGDNNGPHAYLLPETTRSEKLKEQEMFFLKLESQVYEEWALGDLRIEVRDVGERTLKRARDVFRRAMPQLKILMIKDGIGSTRSSKMDSGDWYHEWRCTT